MTVSTLDEESVSTLVTEVSVDSLVSICVAPKSVNSQDPQQDSNDQSLNKISSCCFPRRIKSPVRTHPVFVQWWET